MVEARHSTGVLRLEDEQQRPNSALIWWLALPVIGENLCILLVQWSDFYLSGQLLGRIEYLAAAIVSGYLLWLFDSVAALVTVGTHAIVARRMGAGQFTEAARYTRQSLGAAAMLGILLGLALWQTSSTLTGWSLKGEAQQLATRYLCILAPSLPFQMVLFTGAACLRAAGYTLAGMWIGLFVNVVNLVFSWSLTVGLGPIPALGWNGIALGTSLGFIAGAFLTLAWLHRGCGHLRAPWGFAYPDGVAIRAIFRVGIPGATTSVSMVLGHLWYLSIIGRLGDASMSAHGVAIRCESLSWLAGEGLAAAVTTLVGQSLGAGRPDLARAFGKLVALRCMVLMTFMGCCFYFFAIPLFHFFVPSQEYQVMEIGVPVLQLIAFVQPALALLLVVSGVLRGAGETRWPLVYTFVGVFLVRLPLTFVFTGMVFTWGLYGAWMAMFIDVALRCLVALWCFRAAGWTTIKV